MNNIKKILLEIIAGFLLVMISLCARGSIETVYADNSNTLTVDVGSTSSVADAIQSVLDYVHSQNDGTVYTVKIPAGSYNLDGTLHIYGNTTLDVTGVTFTYTKTTGNMLMLGTPSINKDAETMGGYGTLKNISVIGGIWIGNDSNTSTIIRMAHATNVTIEQCVLQGGGCTHQMEIASIDGFTVRDCTFQDMEGKLTTGKKEALQLDIPCSEYIFGGVVLDGTPMKNVLITGCTFKNVPRGVGTHNILLGQYHTNIKITNNYFENVNGECIIALNYQNCEITGNTIKDCGAGIVVESFRYFVDADTDIKATYASVYGGTEKFTGKINPNAKTTVSGNTISISSDKKSDEVVGILVYGYKLTKNQQAIGNGSNDLIKADNYYISNVKVKNNTVESPGWGIHLSDARNCTVSGNTITCTDPTYGEDGIFVEEQSKNISIKNNKISDSAEFGIRVENSSQASVISGNTITSSHNYAISIYDRSTVKGNIEKNTIKDCDQTGISLQVESKVKNISKNKITNCKANGITLYDGSRCEKSITGNTITGTGQNGILLNKDGRANAISNNKISSAKGNAIYVENSSTVKSSVTGNKITASSGAGIYIKSCRNSLSIRKNSIKKCGSTSVVINTSSKKTITVKNNSIKVKKGKKRLAVVKGKVKSDI